MTMTRVVSALFGLWPMLAFASTPLPTYGTYYGGTILTTDHPANSLATLNAKPAMTRAAGVPSGTCTQLLDLYLNTINGDLYVCAATNTWLKFTGAAGAGAWGRITGTLATQTDLQTALNAKLGTGVTQPRRRLWRRCQLLALPAAIRLEFWRTATQPAARRSAVGAALRP